MSIGKNIKKYRTQKGMTQRELAEAIGVSVQAISKWECGSTPDISQIIPLSSVLNVSPNELLDYMDERKHKIPATGHEDALFLSMQNKRLGVRSVEKLVKKILAS